MRRGARGSRNGSTGSTFSSRKWGPSDHSHSALRGAGRGANRRALHDTDSRPMSAATPHGQAGSKSPSAKVKLAVGAIGIVFGDIGTSPIYAFRETFVGPHPLTLDTLHLMGVVSLIFWAM